MQVKLTQIALRFGGKDHPEGSVLTADVDAPLALLQARVDAGQGEIVIDGEDAPAVVPETPEQKAAAKAAAKAKAAETKAAAKAQANG